MGAVVDDGFAAHVSPGERATRGRGVVFSTDGIFGSCFSISLLDFAFVV